MKCEGIPASGGIGIGTAVLVAEPDLGYGDVVFSGVEAEKARLAGAVAVFIRETSAMAESLRAQLGDKQAEILSGQVMMVSDPYMTSQMNATIENGVCAEAAVDSVCGMYVELFSSMEDELMRQRALDVEDLRRRLLSILLGRPRVELNQIPPDSVLVVRDFTPSMTAGLRRENVAAIVTENGGTTSHSAILARTMSMPAVLSVPNITEILSGGETLVVDGSAGTVLVNPDEDVLRDCRARQGEEQARQADLLRFRTRPTHTADGEPVSLCCNITSPRDVPNVLEHTGEGVGLFRTEFLFMNRSTPPNEEEQFRIYQDAARRLEGREIIIRTLDIGGDKEIACLDMEREENPFLGFRAIRYCLSRPDLFKTQLSAILRASAYGSIRILLPFVSCVDEVRSARVLLEETKCRLAQEGVPFNKDIPLGVMVETPAAVFLADKLAREADFFSIGTNDLTQYTLAADRGNNRVSYLCSYFQPALLRAVHTAVSQAKRAGILVGMCGEAAGDPLMTPLLLAFGLDEFSVSPAAVLPIRQAISRWTREEARALADQVMGLSTADEVRACLKANVR
ncbi:phosphoenolpyruvate--protein phosphotransferase [Pseudoflavonifractor sp. CLA-AP-H29]|uniref:Phosphoenolpyruvate-protein phosphotransferase n=1 Tax=Pseudoflavonifractor intestinihominis TaxID=3133171 RepID=A0ABV1ECP7_9FIRM